MAERKPSHFQKEQESRIGFSFETTVLLRQIANRETNIRQLPEGQLYQITGFARFLNRVDLGMQWSDFNRRDSVIQHNYQDNIRIRNLIVPVIQEFLFPDKQMSSSLSRDEKVQIQKTIMHYRDLLYKVSRREDLLPQERVDLLKILDVSHRLRVQQFQASQ